MGNICRSPSAEGVFGKIRAELAPELTVSVDSAGTHAYHVGKAPDTRAVAAARRRGIDISHLRARVVTPADFHAFDYIIAMDRDNLAALEQLRPAASRAAVQLFLDYSLTWPGGSVPDPYYGGAVGFEKVLDMLEEAGREFVTHLRNARGQIR